MPLTQVLMPPRKDFACCDSCRQMPSGEGLSRPASQRQANPRASRGSATSASRSTVRPALHHLGLKTSNLDAMVEWYAKVLGMEPKYQTLRPSGAGVDGGWKIAWLGNDEANHRISIMALPRLADDDQRSRHKGLHHIAFQYHTLDDLLATYTRLKLLSIEPVRAADHGTTTSFYYEDPDRNTIELMVDNFADEEESSEFMRRSPSFARNPMGADVDPDQIHAARKGGMSVAEIHARAYSGEFCGASGFYRHCLAIAATQSISR